jgi:hypothetical protein
MSVAKPPIEAYRRAVGVAPDGTRQAVHGAPRADPL